MNKKIYIGIDNGVSGTIGMTNGSKQKFFHTPVFKSLSYQKTKVKYINRVNVVELQHILQSASERMCYAVIERPFVNPKMFNASISAVRALEATLIVLEILKIPFQYIDSKSWQKEMLPKGLKGRDDLKMASRDIIQRMFPSVDLKGFDDGDGLLMAEWARRHSL